MIDSDALGRSATLKQLGADLHVAMQTHMPLLISGSADASRLVARLVHDRTRADERDAPFVALTPSVMARRLAGFVTGWPSQPAADHSCTLFIEDVDRLSEADQHVLLYFLDVVYAPTSPRPADLPSGIRVITATGADLYARTQDGSFLADLLYRLNVIHVVLPRVRFERPPTGDADRVPEEDLQSLLLSIRADSLQ